MNLNDIVVLPLHLLVLAYVAWTVYRADHMGFDWIRGKIRVLDEARVEKLHLHTWLGLTGMIVTGLLLFWPARDYLLARPQFYVKMVFVGALIINGLVIGNLQKVALRRSYAELSTREKLPLMISGAVSTLSWLGASALAFFLLP